MLALRLEEKDAGALRFLFLGAHCDDIEIGAGGTVLRLVSRYPEAHFHWVTFASNPLRAQEAEASARAFLGDTKNARIEIRAFKESFFPYIGAEIKAYFEQIKQQGNPDLVFTHFRDDRHQDHRLISDLTWNTFRDHFILEYEIPKYDGDLGTPNFFSPLSEKVAEQKIQLLLESFPSQAQRGWFDAETFKGILRLRGMECNAVERYAEAFYCRKATI